MSPTTAALVAAGCVVAGSACLVVAVRRPSPTVASVRGRSLRTDPTAADGGGGPTRTIASGPAGRVVSARLGADLRITGSSVDALIGRCLSTAVVVLLVTVLSLAALATVGAAPPAAWWPVVAAGVATLAVWNVVADVRASAARRRREFRAVADDVVQLVAIGLTTNRSVEEAVEFAVAVGEGDDVEAIRRVVAAAPQTGRPVWEALADLAEHHDLDSLRGLADSLARQAGLGVSVADTVRAEAAVQRSHRLDELTEAADRANDDLSLPTIAMVLGMVLFLAFPVMQRISEAFAA